MVRLPKLLVRSALLALLFMVSGLALNSSEASAAPLTPNYKYEGSSKIAVSGGFVTKGGDGSLPLLNNGKPGESGVDGKYYNGSKGAVYFIRDGAKDLYVTGFNRYFGGIREIPISGSERCYAAIKVKAGGTSGEYIGAIKTQRGFVANDGCTKNVRSIVSDSAIFDSTILSTIGDAQQSTDESGNNIPTCKASDGACMTKRNKAIDAYEAANRCYTGSTSDLSNCAFNTAIVACLRANPGNTYKKCADTQKSLAILDGDFSGIVAETTDEEIQERCQLVPKDKQTECKQKAIEHRDSLKDGGENATSCNIEGVGWFVCPMVNFLSSIVDGAYALIDNFLETTPVNLNTSSDDNVSYKAWSVMRNIANVLFVIAFIVIAYSQLTSMGINNYGIKRMLPRLIIAAILVNMSYIICALFVDLSNFLGYGAKSLLEGVIPVVTAGSGNALTNDGIFSNIAGAVMMGTAGVVVGSLAGFSVFLPVLLSAGVAVFTTVVILIARQAFIVLLVVISPLAFVAFLLPNTESLFKKWLAFFKTMLLVFPVIGLVFGASKLASYIIVNQGGGGLDEWLLQIAGAGIMTIPLFVVPLLMRVAGGVLNRIGGFVNNPNKGPVDAIRKRIDTARKRDVNRMNNAGVNKRAKNPFRRARGAFLRRDAKKTAVDNFQQSEFKRGEAQEVSSAMEDNQDSLLQKATRGKIGQGYRDQMISGGGEGADDRALAQALNISAQISAEEVKAANAIIKNANLTSQQTKELALGNSVTYDTGKKGEGGRSISHTISPGEATQIAAIQETFDIGNVKLTDDLVAASGSMGVDQRQAIMSGMAKLSSGTKYYSGESIDKVGQGEVSGEEGLNQLVAESINGGKFSATNMPTANKYGLERIAKVASQPQKYGLEEDSLNALRTAAVAYKDDKNIARPDKRNADRLEAIGGGREFVKSKDNPETPQPSSTQAGPSAASTLPGANSYTTPSSTTANNPSSTTNITNNTTNNTSTVERKPSAAELRQWNNPQSANLPDPVINIEHTSPPPQVTINTSPASTLPGVDAYNTPPSIIERSPEGDIDRRRENPNGPRRK